MLFGKWFSGLLLMVAASMAMAAQQRSIDLPSGNEMQVQVYPALGQRLVLWFPPEWGLQARVAETASALAEKGVDVWLLDWHGAYFEPVGRDSLNRIDVADVRAVLEQALAAYPEVYLFATNRAAALVLKSLRGQRRPAALAGLMLMHPNLYADTPEAGSEARYLPLVRHTRLPIYLMQPELSAKYWHLNTLIAGLEAGGSVVYRQVLKGVSDGFHLRPGRSEREDEVAARLPRLIASGMRLLGRHRAEDTGVEMVAGTEVKQRISGLKTGLQAVAARPAAAPLTLPLLQGGNYNLAGQRRVVLVNFWATWCPPCVKELPSLNRLQGHFDVRDFQVVGVDVGEDAATVKKFLADIPHAFPIALDVEGHSVKPWKVMAFPTSYLIDKEGRVRYGLFGALEWDDAAVVEIITRLIKE